MGQCTELWMSMCRNINLSANNIFSPNELLGSYLGDDEKDQWKKCFKIVIASMLCTNESIDIFLSLIKLVTIFITRGPLIPS